MKKTPITEEEILDARTPKGAWTAKQLAAWGVPWPPPHGWKAQIIANGYPYEPETGEIVSTKSGDAPITEAGLARMMEASTPNLIDGGDLDIDGQLDIDPAQLLQKVVSAVISAGRADILWEFPEVLAFFGSRIPYRHEVAHLHNIDERQFEAKAKWPNVRPDPSA